MTTQAAGFQRLGLVFQASGKYPWMYSHAANPTPVHLDGDVYRIFFSSRDKDKRSSIAYLDFDVTRRKLEGIATAPVVVPGDIGYFDDSGASAAWVTKTSEGRYYLYYLGWNISANVPFRNAIGVAIGDSLNSFSKYSLAPILDRNPSDPMTISYPCVLQDARGWRMWYGTHIAWSTGKYEMLHYLCHARSEDGLRWHPTGLLELPRGEGEYAFARPSVIYENGKYKMWFAVRGEKYRICSAESDDGLIWERGALSVGGSGSGFDSEVSCYPAVFDHRGTRYMLYCGNGYGLEGFGLAVLD